MFSIKLGASRSKDLGWRDYDQQFRMKKERSPSLSWGDIDMELWVLSISQGHNSNTQKASIQIHMSVIFLFVFVCNFSIPDWSITIFLDPTLLASDNVTGSKFSKSTYSLFTIFL
jgi:hypothetical protein